MNCYYCYCLYQGTTTNSSTKCSLPPAYAPNSFLSPIAISTGPYPTQQRDYSILLLQKLFL